MGDWVKLDESKPEDIRAWCLRALQLPHSEATKLVVPLTHLDRRTLDLETTRMVDDTLYYMLLGEKRKPREAAPEAAQPAVAPEPEREFPA
jgi:hypothetical protein